MSPEQEMADAAALKHQVAEVSDPGIWKCFGSGCWGFQMQGFIFSVQAGLMAEVMTWSSQNVQELKH